MDKEVILMEKWYKKACKEKNPYSDNFQTLWRVIQGARYMYKIIGETEHFHKARELDKKFEKLYHNRIAERKSND